jgi:hypothetical protein
MPSSDKLYALGRGPFLQLSSTCQHTRDGRERVDSRRAEYAVDSVDQVDTVDSITSR